MMMESYERYVGQVFDRRYRIVKVIGIGGMAVVFEALDLLMRRRVAIKMLKDEITHDEQSVKRFINESKAVAMLSHPNIVNIFDVSVKEDHKYIVMELIEGITLKNYMQKKGTLSFAEVVHITEQILRALEHAHSKGIVHRDIKPQNIMLLQNGVIKVADFGIAKLPNAETVTMADKAIGTVFYISPEQASGRTIDCRSDIYSLGATMYEMATGKLPFMADSPVTVALMQVKNKPQPPREINEAIPVGLEQIILTAMEKNPGNRFQSAAQMLRHITTLKSNPSTVFKMSQNESHSDLSRQESGLRKPQEKTKKKSSRSMFPIIAGVASAFLIVCIISGVIVVKQLLNSVNLDLSTSLTVKKFVGEVYYEDMPDELKKLGYEVEVVWVDGSEEDCNQILKQEPAADSVRKINVNKQQYCDLKLTVSRGAVEFELPDYAYSPKEATRIELRDKHRMKVTVEEEYHEFIESGYVIRTQPEAGTKVNAGDEIVLVISRGAEIEYVECPDFRNCNEEAVMKLLEENKLKLGKFTYENSESVNEGLVIRQNRQPKDKIPVGTAIDFIISKGKEVRKLVTTDYSGKSLESVRKMLEDDYSITVEVIEEASDKQEKGYIIRQEPAIGSLLTEGDKVTLYVSNGKSENLVKVPRVVGYDEVEAEAILTSRGLTLNVLTYEYSDTAETGKVFMQTVPPDAEVPRGTVINVKISLGTQGIPETDPAPETFEPETSEPEPETSEPETDEPSPETFEPETSEPVFEGDN